MLTFENKIKIDCSGLKAWTMLLFACAAIHSLQEQARAQPQSPQDSSRAEQVDPWHAPDKYSHFTLSAMLTAGQFFVLREQMELSEKRALTIAITSTAVIGIAKEIFDGVSGKGMPSLKDLAADIAGIALAAAIIRSP